MVAALTRAHGLERRGQRKRHAKRARELLLDRDAIVRDLEQLALESPVRRKAYDERLLHESNGPASGEKQFEDGTVTPQTSRHARPLRAHLRQGQGERA
jgi:hypothetical protein